MDLTPLTMLSADEEAIAGESCEIFPALRDRPVNKSFIEVGNAEEGSEEKQNVSSPPSATLQYSP
jgi:hypothetical protein